MFMSIFFFLICSVSPRVVSGGLLKPGFTLGFTGQCFAIIQGITEHVQRRSVQNGFPFRFLRTVLMFMSIFNMLGFTEHV